MTSYRARSTRTEAEAVPFFVLLFFCFAFFVKSPYGYGSALTEIRQREGEDVSENISSERIQPIFMRLELAKIFPGKNFLL